MKQLFNKSKLEKYANSLRVKTFLSFVKTGEAHLGGCFSIIEILTYLYNHKLTKNDKFILSKSHSSYPLCLILKKKGLNPKLTTHLEIDEKNGIFCTTGSLGHGLPIATGMAIARKKVQKDGSIFVLISDGECQEGTTWESFLISSKHKLDNLIIIIDYNKIQALQKIDDVLPLHNLENKIKAFNLNCINVKNGNDIKAIHLSFNNIKKNKKPTVIILNTIKGKGIKEFENDPVWHARKLTNSDIAIGKKRLGIK